MAWQEARKHCQEASPNSGGDLASIPDEDTNAFLQTLSQNYKKVWVGGHRSDGEEWVWSDGTPWQFEKWHQDQPNNLGAVQTHLLFNVDASGHWADESQFREKSFICSQKGEIVTQYYYTSCEEIMNLFY